MGRLRWLRKKGIKIGHHKPLGGSPLVVVPAPQHLLFPVVQHQGTPAVPMVKKGQQVQVGSLLARAEGHVSAAVHSSVSGTVRAVEETLHPWGIWTPTIVVENDGQDTPAAEQSGVDDPTSLSPDEIRRRVRAAGVVGLGGAMFPTAVKLSPPYQLDTLIVNGCECEPDLSCDHRMLLERSSAVLYGISAIRHCLGIRRAVVAIEANKPDAIRLYRKLAQVHKFFEVDVMPSRYPYGGERVLVPAVTGRDVPPDKYPDAVGVVVMNVGTIVAVAEALRHGWPLTRRAVTVAGAAVARPANLLVRLGTPLNDVLTWTGLKAQPRELVVGGPMMGITVPSGDVPVIKGTTGILARTVVELHHFRESACLHCGRCTETCPAGLMPTQLARLSARGRFDEAAALGATQCMECGICTYRCPADLPITQLIRMAKREILKKTAADPKDDATTPVAMVMNGADNNQGEAVG